MDEVLQGRLMSAAQRLHSSSSSRLEVPENMCAIREAIAEAQRTFQALERKHRLEIEREDALNRMSNVVFLSARQ
jgi:hypothetical protein